MVASRGAMACSRHTPWLALQLPTGFLRDPSGVVTKDPNREVQERIALVFESFLSVRTAVKVTRTLAARGLGLPRRDRHGEVCWRRPTIPAVTDMLKIPAYAGAFVYGRTRQQTSSGGRPQKSPRPAMDWRIVVKDRYPAYISWDTFERSRPCCAREAREADGILHGGSVSTKSGTRTPITRVLLSANAGAYWPHDARNLCADSLRDALFRTR